MDTPEAAATTVALPQPAASLPAVNRRLVDRIVSGAGWTLGSSAANQGVRLVAGLVMARLLTPHDYGLAGMALIFSALVLILSDLSLGAALVQRTHITETDCSTVFWTSLGVGILLTAGGVAASPLLADFYGEPSVQPLFAVVSLTFLLTSLQTTQAALLQRQMNFRLVGLRVSSATFLACCAGVAAAAAGAGAWALIVQQIVLGSVATAFLWFGTSWRPRFTYSRKSLTNLGGFGLNVFGGRVMSYLSGNVDNVLIGRFLGSRALGAYALAFNLMLLPLSRLSLPLQDVLFPALAEIKEDRSRLVSIWLRATRVLTAVVAAPMLGLIVVAPDVVHVLLGAKWNPAIPVLRVLAIVGVLQAVADPRNVLMAIDRTRLVLVFGVVEAVLIVLGVVAGLHWGIVGVAVCIAAVEVPLRLLYVRAATGAIGIPFAAFARSVGGVAWSVIAMAGGVVALHVGLIELHVGATPRLVVVVVAGAVLYVAALWRWAPDLLTDLRSLVTTRLRPAPAAQT